MKICTECNKPINANRLFLLPKATKCTGCQSKNDVYIRRFDDSAKDGEVQSSTYFFANPQLEAAIRQFNGSTPYDSLGYNEDTNIIPVVYEGPASIFSTGEEL